MADLLDPEIKEVHVGTAEIRAIFTVGRGIVAGCMVLEGKILRDKYARITSYNVCYTKLLRLVYGRIHYQK